MLEDTQVRHLSPHTQRAYVENVARFARHFGRSPADLGPEETRTYQIYLIRERHLAPSSLEIAVCALRVLYKSLNQNPDGALCWHTPACSLARASNSPKQVSIT